MTQHTPGPWYEAKTGNHQGLVISEKTSANIAVTYDKADARLIAAAPEMLALIQRYLKTASPDGAMDLADVDTDARALLARVEGDK